MSRLIDFYRGTGTDTEGRTLADIWAYSDDEMEEVHDFIQWCFPLRETSRFNPDAPLLTDADIAAFLADPRLRENLLRSFREFLAFLGLHHEDGKVTKSADFDRLSEVWRDPNHNWLRITRVLHCTRLLGLGAESRAFFDFLKDLRDGGSTGITAETLRYWEGAVEGTPV